MAATRHDQREEQRLEAVRHYEILDTPRDGAFDRVCALAARWCDVPIATVTIVDEDRIWFKACKGLDAVEVPREPGLCASAILRDATYVVSDASNDPRSSANSLVCGDLGVRFYAGAPIVTRSGHRLGTVNVIDTRPRTLEPGAAEALHDLAALVMDHLELRLEAIQAVGAERRELAQARVERDDAEALARTLQETLSPSRLPAIEGLELASDHRPFAPELVGGDFYDAFPLSDVRTGFFLGDVCGKGPGAASTTSLARYTLRTAAMLKQLPADILGDLNAALFLEAPDDPPMCTAIYGHLDCDANGADVELVCGGHPAPLVLRADGSVEVALARGTLLGVVAKPTAKPFRTRLVPGDTLVLYTDGILDLTLDGALLDEDRLAGLIANRGGPWTAARAIALLRELVEELSDSLRDDVALLAIGIPAA
jgi:phosphoserine phosphatase RsbU/P